MSKSKNESASPRRLFTVKAPVEDFSGVRFGVSIAKGVGQTIDLEAARLCENAGYVVTDAETGETLAECFPRLAE